MEWKGPLSVMSIRGKAWIQEPCLATNLHHSPANSPSGIRLIMASAFLGSLQLTLPMSVITTVGFTVFTLI